MREKDLNLLWKFTLRIGMYTGKENQDTIAAFLLGYEIGTNDECKFIERLSDSIKNEYKIEAIATGWIGQVERLAQKLEMDWVTIFKKQSLKIITKEFNNPIKREFQESIRKRIVGKMRGVDNHFQRDWITDWFGIVDLTANWHKEIWSDKELQLMVDIEEELKSFGKVREIKSKVEPTQKLKDTCKKLLEIINKNENES